MLSGLSCTSWTAISGTTSLVSSTSLSYSGGSLYAGHSLTSGSYVLQRYSGSGTTWVTLTSPSVGSGNSYSYSPIVGDGTNLYVSGSYYSTSSQKTLGFLYKCSNPTVSCSSWADITPNAGITAQAPVLNVMPSGGVIYIGGKTSSGSLLFAAKYNGSSWQGMTIWNSLYYSSVTSIVSYGGSLYVGVGESKDNITGGLAAAIYRKDGSSWTQVAGDGSNGSWNYFQDIYSNVNALVNYNGKLCAGLSADTAGNDEVWCYDGNTWAKIGGDGLKGGWSGSLAVYALAVYNNALYAGIGGVSPGYASLWRYDGSAWTQVGGNNINGSWSSADTVYRVDSLLAANGKLYVGLGSGNNAVNSSLIYQYDGTTWTQIGGPSTPGNWTYSYSDVSSMIMYEGSLYAGLGQQTSYQHYAAVWKYSGSGTGWSQVGGGGINGSWSSGSYAAATIGAMAIYNGSLYVGTSAPNNTNTGAAGSLYKYSNGQWSSAFTMDMGSNFESLYVYGGALYSSLSGSYYVGGDADYWIYSANLISYGANAVLQSSTNNWNSSWHKVAASYDGTTMKLYVDGSLDASLATSIAVQNSNLPLLVGAGHTSSGDYLNGSIDELRLSNVARTSFPNYQYSNTPQTATLANAAHKNGVWHWDGWSQDAVLNGGTVKYRLSTDGGVTWQWWNNTSWTTSTDASSMSNDVNTINSHISTLPAGFGGITWQAVLKGDGTQQVTLNSVSMASTSDTTAPVANASGIQAKKAVGDSSYNLDSNGWTNGSSPYFSWTGGSDDKSGILGYCLYLGQDNTADPVTTKGMLGNSPTATGNNCQFLVTGTNVNLGTAGYLAAPLTTSNQPYYLLIKAIDKAGNVIGTTAEFHFRFDNTPPANPTYITSPSGFVNNKQVALTWPYSGVDAASDSNSGVLGLQYKINNSVWYGDDHSGTGDINDLLFNDGTYTTQNTPDFANLNEGVNTVYFRTWDTAGNVSPTSVTALIKLNTTGAPSQPLELQVTPTTSATNSFAFSWNRPNSLVGDAGNVTYCYVVNNLPNASNCSYTAPGATSLPAGPYATQPGINTLYLVARDESHNINYANYASVDFSANTPAPGMPLNIDVSDVSVKTTHNWRLAITWDVPTDVGTGVSVYKIYRSTDNNSFNQIGTSTSTSYIDTNLTQQRYYYRAVACDSANNCSADSSVVNGYPTGKFTSPPVMTSEPVVSNITTRHAAVTWTTDRVSDSKIAMGTKSGSYDPPETLIADTVTDHRVDLSNLSAGTTYYLVARWTDEDGNTGHSQEISFTTSPAPVIKEVNTDRIGLSDTTISFTSVGAYRVAMYYGVSDSFGGIKSLNTSASESTYSLDLDGLNDGTKYFFQPVAYDSEGNAYPGNIFSFTTPPRPRITNLRFQPVSGEPTSTQQITWTTNVPTDSTVTYGVVGSNGIDVTKPQMTTDHSLTVSGLEDNSVYFLVARSRDVSGNLVVSDRQQFHTALDTRPPKISNIEVETSIRGTGSQSRGQIIVSWTTDELATSQVAYGTGTNLKVLNNKTAEDSALSTEHIVIISDLSTSELYTVQPISNDKAGNDAAGSSQTAIIGRGSDDVLTIVLNTLKKLFGL